MSTREWLDGVFRALTIMVSTRKLLLSIGVTTGVVICIVVILHFLNFRISFQMGRESDHMLGCVSSEPEQQRIEAIYRDRLSKLQVVLDATEQDIRRLQALKNRIMQNAIPAPMREEIHSNEDERNVPPLPDSHSRIDSNRPLTNSHQDAVQEITKFQKKVADLSADWNQQLKWLQALPTGIPISGDFKVTRGFGRLRSPSTGKNVSHEGLDFEVKNTASVISAASGTVSRISKEKYLGYFVEITHAEGFMTRYARVRNISVEEGQSVERGQHIAEVGGEGRRQEHLHYEVYRNGSVINPVQVLPISNDALVERP